MRRRSRSDVTTITACLIDLHANATKVIKSVGVLADVNIELKDVYLGLFQKVTYEFNVLARI